MFQAKGFGFNILAFPFKTNRHVIINTPQTNKKQTKSNSFRADYKADAIHLYMNYPGFSSVPSFPTQFTEADKSLEIL